MPLALLEGPGLPGDPQSTAAQAACEQVHQAVLAVPGTLVERREGTYYDEHLRRDIAGCMIHVSGIFGELGGRSNPGDSIIQLLTAQGWRQEPRYSADGPEGTCFSFSNGDVWCFVRGQWHGDDDADPEYVPSDVYQFFICCTRFEGDAPDDREDE